MVPGLAVHQLAVAVADPGRAGRGLRRAAVPPGGMDQPAPRRATMDTLVSMGTLAAFGWSLWALFFGTAGETGHDPPVQFRHPPQRRRRATSTWKPPPGSPCSSSPAGTSRRGPSAAPAPPCAPCCTWAPRTSRSCATAPRCASRSTSSRSVTGSWYAPARRSPPTAWSRTASSAVDASMLTGESVPVEVDRRRPGGRCHGQHRRPAGRTGHPGRRGHPAGPDGAAGRAGAGRQGRGAAAGRPDLRRVRTGRHRPRRRHPGLLDRHRHRPDGRVHRRGRGADHRLPVRPRPGHADRATGRHRPRRAARASSSRDPRCSSPPEPWTRSCWTRPARSPPAR